MELLDLLPQVRYRVLQGTVRREAGQVRCDTRELQAGDVFVCVEGYRTDGHLFAREAAARGASALVVRRPVRCPAQVTVLQVSDTRWALAAMSAAYWEYPADALQVTGITGTKGKTTTAWMLREIFRQAGRRCGLVGTIETDTGERRFPSDRTTPESCRLMEYFSEMRRAGMTHAVLEVSSQALKLERTACVPFRTGIFTNLGEDHIGPGEHESPAKYRQCKHLLFLQCEVGIGNADDPWYEEMFARTGCRKVTFGTGAGADYRAVRIRPVRDGEGPGMAFQIAGYDGEIRLPLPGIFNVYNALAAAAAALDTGVPFADMRAALAGISVPGRMERIRADDGRLVYVDYAHNAMSFESALLTLRPCARGRLLTVFGCGGNRARQRRREMGRIAGRLADTVILTSDNPRDEEPEAILRDIAAGVEETSGACLLVPDRREAVRLAVRQCRPGDVLLVAGKGHETYQEIRGARLALDDRELVRAALDGEKNRQG